MNVEGVYAISLPIILAHGIVPFDALYRPLLQAGLRRLLRQPDKYDYFSGIAGHLENHGYTVFAPRVPFAAQVHKRALALKRRIEVILESTGADRVHIIAHSMGGLDARHMIVDFDMADHVATLTTIGTPHCGTCFADFGLAKVNWLIGFTSLFGLNLEGFRDLSTEAAAAFNERALNAEAQNHVRYATYAAHQRHGRIFTPLKLPWKYIARREGDNDGLVSVTSAAWTDRLGSKTVRQEAFPVPADHLNELAWWEPCELRAPRQARRPFKNKIRDAYLKMVRDAERED
ncbi:MAG: alpha/beta fold hydrolase [Gemmatimonadetes bacterium]|nr:alpha/beta fold hydrolase [Gemmatimonadota bacterium]